MCRSEDFPPYGPDVLGVAYVSEWSDFLDIPTFIRKGGFAVVMFERDPEEIGPESFEDAELRLDAQASVHEFAPGPDGRCMAYLIRHGKRGARCGSTQRYSVLHDDPESEFRQMHDHGGGDCMCFEDDPRGYFGAMREYVNGTRYEPAQQTCGCPIDYHLADCPIVTARLGSLMSEWDDEEGGAM